MYVRILTTFTGIAKEFVVPGWRVGWLVMHDKGTGRLAELSAGIRSLSQIILGATLLALPCFVCVIRNVLCYRALGQWFLIG